MQLRLSIRVYDFTNHIQLLSRLAKTTLASTDKETFQNNSQDGKKVVERLLLPVRSNQSFSSEAQISNLRQTLQWNNFYHRCCTFWGVWSPTLHNS